MGNIKIDPEFQSLIPPLSTEERAGLEANIRAHGCRAPLDVWDGVLVDGHNRYEICTRLGIPFETRPIEFENRRAARIWIRNNQMGRRNLHEFVRTELALENQAEIAAQAKERQREAGEVHGRGQKVTENLREPIQPRHERETSNVIGKAAGVSGRTVDKVKKIKATGTPELQQAIRENKVSISAAVELATLPAAKQIEVVAKDNVSIRDAAKAVKATHVGHNSGENEWYTPPEFIEAARAVMGSIDLDPASCEVANKTVKAKQFYSAIDDGLAQKWHGNVWMNPPYAQPLIAQFSSAVAEKYKAGEVDQAVVLVNNATETEWFQTMLAEASAVCFPKSRIRFLDKVGNPIGAPLQGQAILYLGPNVDAFVMVFAKFGVICWRDSA